MKVVIDTNVLMAGILKEGIVRKVLLSSDVDFYIPDGGLSEVEKHIPELMEKSKMSSSEIEQVILMLLEHIEIIPAEKVKEYFDEAVEIMRLIHLNDAPFIAGALAIKADGIWSFDEHFKKQMKVRLLSTRNLLDLNI